jgi:hypothetical protein
MLTLEAPPAERLWDEVLPIEARDDQRECTRPRWRVAPGQPGRNVLALARVPAGNLAAMHERLAAERELAHKASLDRRYGR